MTTLTKKTQVLEVLRKGGQIQGKGRFPYLIDRDGNRIHAWQTAIKLAMQAQQSETQVLQRLMEELADETARSDIESYCAKTEETPAGWHNTLDLGELVNPDDAKDFEEIVARAKRYLELRGDSTIGYRVVRRRNRNLIRFEARP